jgi:hypothetical protein
MVIFGCPADQLIGTTEMETTSSTPGFVGGLQCDHKKFVTKSTNVLSGK